MSKKKESKEVELGKLDKKLTTVNVNKLVKETHFDSYDDNLLERARTQWQFGDWVSLVKLDRESMQHHPDRAKLALLVAAGHLQSNDPSMSRKFVRLAQDWGCNKKLISKILIAGVHNSLGRVAAVTGRQLLAFKHFKSAIAIGMSKSETRLLAQARMQMQIEQLKLSFVPVALHQELQQSPKSISSNEIDFPDEQQVNTDVTFSPVAYSYYQTVSRDAADKSTPPYIQFDTKSLPRSGLHYIRNTFSKVLEDHFSFCEWYHEPGCCKKMPCALTGYSQQGEKTQTARLRLTKSHDFALDDPVFLPMFSLRRVILVRNPLFLLTSWFALDQLGKHNSKFNYMKKIWLSHEPEILLTAYQVLDDTFETPSSNSLSAWLDEKTQYILDFLDKWVKPTLDNPQPFCQIVRYEEINPFILETLTELCNYLPDGTKERIDRFKSDGMKQFHPRQDPFYTPSKKLASYLADNANLFSITANKILSSSPTGTFRNDYNV